MMASGSFVLTFNEIVLLPLIEEAVRVFEKQQHVEARWTEIRYDDAHNQTIVRLDVTRQLEPVSGENTPPAIGA
jgi:hypothetical protein